MVAAGNMKRICKIIIMFNRYDDCRFHHKHDKHRRLVSSAHPSCEQVRNLSALSLCCGQRHTTSAFAVRPKDNGWRMFSLLGHLISDSRQQLCYFNLYMPSCRQHPALRLSGNFQPTPLLHHWRAQFLRRCSMFMRFVLNISVPLPVRRWRRRRPFLTCIVGREHATCQCRTFRRHMIWLWSGDIHPVHVTLEWRFWQIISIVCADSLSVWGLTDVRGAGAHNFCYVFSVHGWKAIIRIYSDVCAEKTRKAVHHYAIRWAFWIQTHNILCAWRRRGE